MLVEVCRKAHNRKGKTWVSNFNFYHRGSACLGRDLVTLCAHSGFTTGKFL